MALAEKIRQITGGKFARDSLVSVFAQFSNAALSLVTAVLFARMLGASEFGAYTVAFAWATLLAVPSRIGLDSYITRELSVRLSNKDWRRSLGIVISALMLVLLASSSLGIVAYGLFLWFDPDIDPALKQLFGYSCLLVPALSMEIIIHAILRAAGHNSVAVMVRFFLRPLLLISVLLAAHFLDYAFTGLEAILSQMGTILAGTLLLLIAAFLLLPRELRRSPPLLETWSHCRGGMRFLLIAGLGVLISNTDIVMLGFLSTAEEAGMYRVASRVAAVITLTLAAVSMPLGPRLAVLYRESRYEQLKTSFYKANALSLGLALPLCILFLVFNEELLSIFGSEFQAASVLLTLMAVLALFEVFMGPAALCLNMMGKEHIVTLVLAMASVLNIILNLLLIPEYGAMGAVTATAITVVAWRSVIWLKLFQALGILPGGLGLLLGRGGAKD